MENKNKDLTIEQYAQIQQLIRDGLARGYGNIKIIFHEKKVVAVQDILEKRQEIKIFDINSEK